MLAYLAHRFQEIHERIPCAHQLAEAEIIASTILHPQTPPGPVVELGAYKGGMSAKLALACLIAKREFYVCDTFSGLPRAEDHLDIRGKRKIYEPGQYAGSIAEVRAAIESVGGIAQLLVGDFKATLPHLTIQPAVVFMDVDLISSALCALDVLWPRMVPNGIWYTHEAGVLTFVQEVSAAMPGLVLWGAGYGMGPHAANLAYWVKPARVTTFPSHG